MNDFLLVGRVAKPHGIRGEVALDFNAQSLDLLGDSVFLASGPNHATRISAGSPCVKKYTIIGLRLHHHRPLLFLEGIADRTAAGVLQGKSVYVPRARLPKADAGEIYLDELPGLAVFVLQDGHEEPLGHIASVDDIAGQELWTIVTPAGHEVLFPSHEQFVVSIDTDAGRVVITPPPGLLDLYLQ